MDFEIPPQIQSTLDALDEFIEREIRPLEAENDNVRFFDHRREYSRTDFEADGIPRDDWEQLLAAMRPAGRARRARCEQSRDGDHP
jgi:acyl-CoA dehydrogenase